MKKNKIKLSESYLHNILQKSVKKVLREGMYDDEGLHDDLNLTSTSLDNDNNFDDEVEDDSYLRELGEEALNLADQLYSKMEEIRDELRNINDPSVDEYEIEELCDTAESLMNGIGEQFGDPEVYGDMY